MTASSTASAGPVTGDRTAGAEDGLDRAMRRVEDAVMTIRSGDPQPYIDCWADDPDVTLFGRGARSSAATRPSPAPSAG